MERQIEINLKRLWELAQQGKTADEMMQELDISEMSHLENALQGLMQEKGETINVPGLTDKPSVDARYTDSGNRIPPDMPDSPEGSTS